MHCSTTDNDCRSLCDRHLNFCLKEQHFNEILNDLFYGNTVES